MNSTARSHPTFINQRLHDQLLEEGFQYRAEKFVTCKDGIYSHRIYGKILDQSCCEKTARIFFGVISGIVCCIPVFCCSRIRTDEDTCLDSWAESFWTGPCDGNYQRECYIRDEEKTKQVKEEDFAELGMKNKSNEEIQAYLSRHEGEIIQTPYRHTFLPLHLPNCGLSYLIFIPYNNRDQAMLTCCWKTDTAKKPLTSHELVEEGMRQSANYRGSGQRKPGKKTPLLDT